MRAVNLVGDSAESGFPLPKPVSMHREYLNEHIDPLGTVTALDRVVHADTSKK